MSEVSVLERAAYWARIATYCVVALGVLDVFEWGLRNVFTQALESLAAQMFYSAYNFTIVPMLVAFAVNGRWIYVAARYYQSRATPKAPIRPHWAVWSNLVPIANFIAPFIQLCRIYAIAQAAGNPRPKWLWIWWLAWISPFILGIVFIGYFALFSPQVLIENGLTLRTEIILLIATGVDILASVFFLRLIKDITQPRLRDSDVFA